VKMLESSSTVAENTYMVRTELSRLFVYLFILKSYQCWSRIIFVAF
jgi:hypothetical protein